MTRYDRLDEPGSSTRRRSKDRPDFSAATVGMVVGVDRGRIIWDHAGDAPHDQQVTAVAVKARELGRRAAVVGDRVRLVGDLSGRPDTLARLVEITDRSSALRRTADDSDPIERVIVANADQIAIVVAATNPEPRLGLIDRALVAALDAGLEPLLVVTKTDLGDATALTGVYGPMGLRCLLVDQKSGAGVAAVAEALKGHSTVLLGHSGVGKSTLVNALVPGAGRATGGVNEVTGRGRHTSTSAVALPLPEDTGWVFDTPGIRSFGLAHVDPSKIIDSYPELDEGADECPRACTHVSVSGGAPPDCALDTWVEQGNAGVAGADRLASLRRLLVALDTPSS